jgi:hypothetical protein
MGSLTIELEAIDADHALADALESPALLERLASGSFEVLELEPEPQRALASDYVADAAGRDARFTRTDDCEPELEGIE